MDNQSDFHDCLWSVFFHNIGKDKKTEIREDDLKFDGIKESLLKANLKFGNQPKHRERGGGTPAKGELREALTTASLRHGGNSGVCTLNCTSGLGLGGWSVGSCD